jgi:hypothetical protein|tara:strand:- start:55 stop:180 length:126 start_codon:yes stop_codon:yes gene_type:complete
MLIKDINASNLTTTTTTLLYNIVVVDIWINFSHKKEPPFGL